MLKPWVLFKGKGQLPDAEIQQYDFRVIAKFNIEGYANEQIILEWIAEQLLPVLHRENPSVSPLSSVTGIAIRTPAPNSHGLISLDVASFHKTPAVLAALSNQTLDNPCWMYSPR